MTAYAGVLFHEADLLIRLDRALIIGEHLEAYLVHVEVSKRIADKDSNGVLAGTLPQ